MTDRPPQTVGQALENDWTYLRLRCALCRHVGRIELQTLPPHEPLAHVIMRARCPRNCRRGMVDVKIGWVRLSRHEKPIGIEGGRIVRIGMN